MSLAVEDWGPICAALGCRNDAAVIARHPTKGKRACCNGCVDPSWEVVRLV